MARPDQKSPLPKGARGSLSQSTGAGLPHLKRLSPAFRRSPGSRPRRLMALSPFDVSESLVDVVISQAVLQARVHGHGLGCSGVFVPERPNCPLDAVKGRHRGLCSVKWIVQLPMHLVLDISLSKWGAQGKSWESLAGTPPCHCLFPREQAGLTSGLRGLWN